MFNRPTPIGIAPGLEQLGAGAEDLAGDLARQQAPQDAQKMDVTLAPDGKVQVATPQNSVILGGAGQDYQRVMADSLVTKTSAAVNEGLTNIQLQHQGGDPVVAKAAFDQYVGSLRSSATAALGADVGNRVADMAQNQASQRWRNLAENNFEMNTRYALQGIQTSISDTQDQMKAMARQGAINTPDWDRLSDKLQDAYDSLGDNKLYGYSPEKIESDQQRAYDLLQGEYVVGRVDAAFDKGGKAAAQKALNDGILNNPNLLVSDPERKSLFAWGMNRLASRSAEQQSAIDALKPVAAEQVKKLVAGNLGPDRFSDQELDATYAQAKSLGSVELAEQLAGARLVGDRTASFRGLPPEQRANVLLSAGQAGIGGPIASGVNSEQGALAYFQSQGWTPAQAAGIVGNLVRESRLQTGARNAGDGSDGSDSIGIGQWNSDRAKNLQAFAASQGKPVTDLGVQLAFVQHELTGSESKAAATLKAAQTPEDAAKAFALGYERPQGFQTGDMAQVAGGQDRIDQARRLAGGGASGAPIPGGGANGITTLGSAPYSAAEVAQNPWLRTAYTHELEIGDAAQVRFAKDLGETILNSEKFAVTPGPGTVNAAANYLQLAQRYPDQLGEQADKVTAALQGTPLGFRAAGSTDGGQSLLEAAQSVARTGGDRLSALTGEYIRTGIEAGQKLLKDDQFEYAHQNEWIPRKPIPLDLSRPETLPLAMAERGAAARTIASYRGIDGVSALTPSDAGQLSNIMTNGGTEQRVAVLSAIAAAKMPEPIMKATLRQLGQDKATLPFAIAGSLASDNPTAARNIVVGQAALQTDPKYAPEEKEFPTEIAKAIPWNDLPDRDTRGGLADAVRAHYAAMSAQANDTTGIMNQARLDASIEAVTGGVRSYRGANFIAPWYGASQADTDAAIRSLTDADFAGAHTGDGSPFPASALKPSLMGSLTWNNWRLQSAGDGKYVVFSGADDNRQTLSSTRYAKGQPVANGTFILDLGAKRAQVERSGLYLAPQSNLSLLYNSALMGGGN